MDFLELFKCIRSRLNVETEPIRTEGEWVLLGGRKFWGKVGKRNFWAAKKNWRCLAILLWWDTELLEGGMAKYFSGGQPKTFGGRSAKNGSGVAKYFRIGVTKIFGGLDGMAKYSRGEA